MNCLFFVVSLSTPEHKLLNPHIHRIFPHTSGISIRSDPQETPQIYNKMLHVFLSKSHFSIEFGCSTEPLSAMLVFFVFSLVLPCENKDSCTSSCCKPITLREGNVVVKNPCLFVEVLEKFLRCVFSVFCKWLTPNNKHLQELDGDKVFGQIFICCKWHCFCFIKRYIRTYNGYTPEV